MPVDEGTSPTPPPPSSLPIMHRSSTPTNSISLVGSPASLSLSASRIPGGSRPWMANPLLWLEQYCRRQEGGIMPTTQLLHLSSEPSLFECILLWRHLESQGLGKSKREAEWYAAINLCRSIELLDAEGLASSASPSPLDSPLGVPLEWTQRPWFAQPKNHLYGHAHARYGLDPLYTVQAEGTQFVATASLALPANPLLAKATGKTKRDATRLAALQLCHLVEQHEQKLSGKETAIEAVPSIVASMPIPVAPTTVPLKSSSKSPQKEKRIPAKEMSCPSPSYLEIPPLDKIKSRLHAHLTSIKATATYEAKKDATGVLVTKVTFGDGSLVGIGKGKNGLVSSRLAAQDLWIKIFQPSRAVLKRVDPTRADLSLPADLKRVAPQEASASNSFKSIRNDGPILMNPNLEPVSVFPSFEAAKPSLQPPNPWFEIAKPAFESAKPLQQDPKLQAGFEPIKPVSEAAFKPARSLHENAKPILPESATPLFEPIRPVSEPAFEPAKPESLSEAAKMSIDTLLEAAKSLTPSDGPPANVPPSPIEPRLAPVKPPATSFQDVLRSMLLKKAETPAVAAPQPPPEPSPPVMEASMSQNENLGSLQKPAMPPGAQQLFNPKGKGKGNIHHAWLVSKSTESIPDDDRHHHAFIHRLIRHGLIRPPQLTVSSFKWQGHEYWNVKCEMVVKKQRFMLESSAWDLDPDKQRNKVVNALSSRLGNIFPQAYSEHKSMTIGGRVRRSSLVSESQPLPAVEAASKQEPVEAPRSETAKGGDPPRREEAPQSETVKRVDPSRREEASRQTHAEVVVESPAQAVVAVSKGGIRLPSRTLQSLSLWMQEPRNQGRYRQMRQEVNSPPSSLQLTSLPPVEASLLEEMSARLLGDLEARLASEAGQALLAHRQELPFYVGLEAPLLASISSCQVTLVTGVHRSSLLLPYLPLSLLDSMTVESMGAQCNVLVAVAGGPMEAIQMALLGADQRLEAVGERIGWDLGEGPRAQASFGSVSFTSRTCLLYTMLANNPHLLGYSHLLVHVHDDWWSELILMRVRSLLQARPELRIILLMGDPLGVPNWLNTRLPSSSLRVLPLPPPPSRLYLLPDLKFILGEEDKREGGGGGGESLLLGRLHRLLAHLCRVTDPLETILVLLDGELIGELLGGEMQRDALQVGWNDPNRFQLLRVHHGMSLEAIASLYYHHHQPQQNPTEESAFTRRLVFSPWWVECGAVHLVDGGQEVEDCLNQADRPVWLKPRHPLGRTTLIDRSLLCPHYYCLVEKVPPVARERLELSEAELAWRSLCLATHVPDSLPTPFTPHLPPKPKLPNLFTARWLSGIPLDPRQSASLLTAIELRAMGAALRSLDLSEWHQLRLEQCLSAHGHLARLIALFARGDGLFHEHDQRLWPPRTPLARHLLSGEDQEIEGEEIDPVLKAFQSWLGEALHWQSRILSSPAFPPKDSGDFTLQEMASFVDKLIRTVPTLLSHEE